MRKWYMTADLSNLARRVPQASDKLTLKKFFRPRKAVFDIHVDTFNLASLIQSRPPYVYAESVPSLERRPSSKANKVTASEVHRIFEAVQHYGLGKVTNLNQSKEFHKTIPQSTAEMQQLTNIAFNQFDQFDIKDFFGVSRYDELTLSFQLAGAAMASESAAGLAGSGGTQVGGPSTAPGSELGGTQAGGASSSASSPDMTSPHHKKSRGGGSPTAAAAAAAAAGGSPMDQSPVRKLVGQFESASK